MTGALSRRVLGVTAVLLLSIGLLASVDASLSPTATAAPTIRSAGDRPNIVLVLSDDQPKGTMAAMPEVSSLIRDKGINFRQAVVPTSLCCPSRSALLSGSLAQTTGVYSNDPDYYGGWPAFEDNENQTIATELSEAGYRTALFGKYMNEYTVYGWQTSGVSSIPPGWDEFVFMDPFGDKDSAYYQYSLAGTQIDGPFGSTEADYSTDVLRDRAVDFIESTPSDQPFFLELSVFGAHGPFRPAPRHRGAWADRPFSRPAGMNERDMSDKPPWLRDLPPVSQEKMATEQQRRMETLMSVDEAVRALVRTLGDRMSNTLFIYLSDNGLMQGIHRLEGKDKPYQAATSIPLFMRWDGVIEPGSVSDRVTPNIDVTGTIAEAAGVSWPMDGRSALSTGRPGVILEAVTNEPRPAYCGWRSKRYLYVRYSGGEERELYDYRVDPHELVNVAGKAKYQSVEAHLDQKTEQNCQPLPPDFSWN